MQPPGCGTLLDTRNTQPRPWGRRSCRLPVWAMGRTNRPSPRDGPPAVLFVIRLGRSKTLAAIERSKLNSGL
jgi:hypothetical protein